MTEKQNENKGFAEAKNQVMNTVGGDKVKQIKKAVDFKNAENKTQAAKEIAAETAKTAIDASTGGAATVATNVWKHRNMVFTAALAAIILIVFVLYTAISTLSRSSEELGQFKSPPVALTENQNGSISEVVSGSYIDLYRDLAAEQQVPWPIVAAVGDVLTRHGNISPYDTIERGNLQNSLYYNPSVLQTSLEQNQITVFGDGTAQQIFENVSTVNQTVSDISQTYTIVDVASNIGAAVNNTKIVVSASVGDYMNQPASQTETETSNEQYLAEYMTSIQSIIQTLQNNECVYWIGLPETGWETEWEPALTPEDFNNIDDFPATWQYYIPETITDNTILDEETVNEIVSEMESYFNDCLPEETTNFETPTETEAISTQTFPQPNPPITSDNTPQIIEANSENPLLNEGHGPLLLKPVIVDQIQALQNNEPLPSEPLFSLEITEENTFYRGHNLQDATTSVQLLTQWMRLQAETVTLEQFLEQYQPSNIATSIIDDQEIILDNQGITITQTYVDSLPNSGYDLQIIKEIEAFWKVVLSFAPVQWETTSTPPPPQIEQTASFGILTDPINSTIAEQIGTTLKTANNIWVKEDTTELPLDTLNTLTSLTEHNHIYEGYITLLGEDTLTPLTGDPEMLAEWQETAAEQTIQLETNPVDLGVTIYGDHSAGTAVTNMVNLPEIYGDIANQETSTFGTLQNLETINNRIDSTNNPRRLIIIATATDYYQNTSLTDYQTAVNQTIAANSHLNCVAWIGTPQDGWDATNPETETPYFTQTNTENATPSDYNDIIQNTIPTNWQYYDTDNDITFVQTPTGTTPAIQPSDLETLINQTITDLQNCVQEETVNNQNIENYFRQTLTAYAQQTQGKFVILGIPETNQLAIQTATQIAETQNHIKIHEITGNETADAITLANLLTTGNTPPTPQFTPTEECRNILNPAITNNTEPFNNIRQPGETENDYINAITETYQNSTIGQTIENGCQGNITNPNWITYIQTQTNQPLPNLTTYQTWLNNQNNTTTTGAINQTNLTIETWTQQTLRLAQEYVTYTGANLTGQTNLGALTAAGIPTNVAESYITAIQKIRQLNPECDIPVEHLAAHGHVESRHGQIYGNTHQLDENSNWQPPIIGPELNGNPFKAIPDTDNGQYDGNTTWDHAVGHAQFIPTTWEIYKVDGNDDGEINPQNLWDMSATAANYLCESLPEGGSFFVQDDTRQAVWAYNQSEKYFDDVMTERRRLESITLQFATPNTFAEIQINPGDPVDTVWVTGPQGNRIEVHVALAPAVQALLQHAYENGYNLGGWGYRSPERTAELRIINGCPDVYTSPSSSCRVPTARPGTSLHERGIAIDFYCVTPSNPQVRFADCVNAAGERAFDWMSLNAAQYGLKNFPKEAWHWSTTGG